MKKIVINLSNKTLYTFLAILGLALLSVGLYAYETANPATFGHSASEIEIDDTLCNRITGHNCGYDNTAGAETDPTVPANIKDGISWNEKMINTLDGQEKSPIFF